MRKNCTVTLIVGAVLGTLFALGGPAIADTPVSSLGSGQSLSAGQALASPDGRFSAVMQSDGNFVVYGPSGATWASGTAGIGQGSSVSMQADGNLVVYAANGTAAFSSNTARSINDVLTLQNDGNLVVYASGGLPLWSSYGGRTGNGQNTLSAGSTLQPGQSITSPNGSYTAIMQAGDGNFVLEGPSGATWSTGAQSGAGTVAAMQTDGNFVLYAPGYRATYSTSTNTGNGNRLVVQDDGNLVIYNASNTALWAKGNLISAPPAQTNSSDPAVAWAIRHEGQVYATAAEQRDSSHQWSGYCWTFVRDAFGGRLATTPHTPQEGWAYYSARGMTHQGAPPAGTVAFWQLGSTGHAAVAIGGQTIGTFGQSSERLAVARRNGTDHNGIRYLGWVRP